MRKDSTLWAYFADIEVNFVLTSSFNVLSHPFFPQLFGSSAFPQGDQLFPK